MPASYQRAPEAEKLAQSVIAAKFPKLLEVEVTCECWFVSSEQGLKLHGYPCYATVKINSYKERSKGRKDCTIEIDRERWDELKPREREALLHHELTHLQVATKKCRKSDGTEYFVVKYDDLGRPKLKMRLHDLEIGIFKDNIAAYGSDSLDLKQLQPVVEYAQGLLPWG